MNALSRTWLASALTALLAVPGVASTAEYRVTELPWAPTYWRAPYVLTNSGPVQLAAPPDGGYGFYGLAANAAGDMAGYDLQAHGQTSAAVLTPAGIKYLPDGAEYPRAVDINAHGQVIVNSYGAYPVAVLVGSGSQVQRLDPLSNKFDDLPPESPFSPVAWGTALNDSGQVVGTSETATRQEHAVLWRDGQIIDLHANNSTGSSASDINNAGQIVVNYRYDNGLTRAGVWTNGSLAYLDGLSDRSTHGTAINGAGWVAGWAEEANGAQHATLWQDGLVFDINALVIGDTGRLGHLEVAYGITDLGQILAAGRSQTGDLHDYLLTPVPEPSEWALLMCGLGIVFMRRRTRAAGPTTPSTRQCQS